MYKICIKVYVTKFGALLGKYNNDERDKQLEDRSKYNNFVIGHRTLPGYSNKQRQEVLRNRESGWINDTRIRSISGAEML